MADQRGAGVPPVEWPHSKLAVHATNGR